MKWKVLTLVLERFWLQIYYKSENESAPWGKHHHIFFKNCVLYPIHTSEGTFFTKIFDRSLVLTKIQQQQMFSVLVLLEDSKNVWSDHLPKIIGNPPAKNRFFHFRHAVLLLDTLLLVKLLGRWKVRRFSYLTFSIGFSPGRKKGGWPWGAARPGKADPPRLQVSTCSPRLV